MRELSYEIRPADAHDIAYWAKSGREPTLATAMLRHCYRVAAREFDARTLLIAGQRLLTIGVVGEWSGDLAGLVGEVWSFMSPIEVLRRHKRVLRCAMPEILEDADIATRYRRITALIDRDNREAKQFAAHFGFKPRFGGSVMPVELGGKWFFPWDLNFEKEAM